MRKEKSAFNLEEGVLFLLPGDWRQGQIRNSEYPRELPSSMYFIFSVRCMHPFLQIRGPLAVTKDGKRFPGNGWLISNASKKPWSKKEFYASMHRFAGNYGFMEYWQIVKNPLIKGIKRERFQIWKVDPDRGRSQREEGILVDDTDARWRGGICFQALGHFRSTFSEYDSAVWDREVRFPLGGRYETWIPKTKKRGKRA